MAVGVPVGYSAEVMRTDYAAPGWGSVYMIGLAVIIEALALLTLGLVRPWGEVAPRWIPLIGGRSLNPKAVTVAAATGAVLVTLVTTSQLFVWHMMGGGHLSGTALTVMGASYAPLLAWGPLLALVTLSYHRRHR